MEAKFTPGPWHVMIDNEEYADIPAIHADSVAIIDRVNGKFWDSKDENRANAYLIAAAPEMYEILEEVLSELKEHTPDRHLYSQKLIESVLKKARGE